MESCCGVYRPRNPSATALYGLLESLYERVKGLWDEVFEERYGFWRSFVEQAVFRYLDWRDGSRQTAVGSYISDIYSFTFEESSIQDGVSTRKAYTGFQR